MLFTYLLLLTSVHSFIISDDQLIQHVNSAQNLWIAGHQNTPRHKILGNLMKPKHVAPHNFLETVPIEVADSIPEHYDVRDHWSQCISINNIRDQSNCGSCWAVAAAETISDRTCIASNGEVNTLLSAEDLLTCCTGNWNCGDGCEGGYPIQAWRYWVHRGLVTGGSYEDQYGCKPYSIAPCGETVNGFTWPKCSINEVSTPECVQECTSNRSYSVLYEEDKHYGASAYAVGREVDQIQSEILKNGPVEVGFMVYADFYQYKSGIYHHVAGQALGGHAVKILGWGVEKGTPYWLAANSWNVNWGENGYFRILRGVDECGIESAVVAGIPDLKRRK
uniref:Pept_C1 domain-containing protein n=2 Tax=Caenorhabditis tropicalis TaxID=1561998 RepID=A0A1I7TW37_9PELO